MLKFLQRRLAARDERGAVALVVGLLFTSVLVGIGAITVDIGQQRVARRDMQSLADVVALDMGRLLDGKQTKAQLDASSVWSTNLSRSTARNSTTYGTTPTVTYELGTTDAAGTFTAYTSAQSAQVPTAVRITARTQVGFGFGFASSGGAVGSAIGSADQTACFRLGSYAARLNTSNSMLFTNLLNGALGNINVSAASYTGLAGASVGLGPLSTALGLAGPSSLATATVTEGQLLAATATVLTNQGNTTGAAAVNAIIAQLNSSSTGSTVLGQAVNLGSAIGSAAVGVGQGSVAAGTINALDLVSGSAFLINGTNTLSIPGLNTSLGLTGTGLTQTTKLGQGLEQTCARLRDPVSVRTVTTTQADISITGQLASVATPSSLSGLTLTANAGSTKIGINLAKASGILTNVVCGSATTANPTGLDMSVTSAVTNLSLNQTFNVSGSLTSSALLGNLLGSLLGTVVSVDVTGTVSYNAVSNQPSSTKTVQLRVPISPPDYATGVPTGNGDLGLTLNPTATTTLTLTARGALGGIINLTADQQLQLGSGIASAITNGLVNPLITNINTALVSPLQNLLGLETGGADAYFGTLNSPPVSCQATRLAG